MNPPFSNPRQPIPDVPPLSTNLVNSIVETFEMFFNLVIAVAMAKES